MADHDIQIGRHRERIREVVLFLQSILALLRSACSVPNVPLVEGDADRVLNVLLVACTLDQRLAHAQRPVGLMRLEHVAVVVGAAGIQMDAVVPHVWREAVDDGLVPVGPAPLPAADQLDAGISPLHDRGELTRLADIVLGGAGADLPGAVHLVAQTPVLDVVRLWVAVGAAQVGPVRIPGAVAILDPGLRLVHAARAHVDADVRLGAEDATVLHEFVGPEAVRLLAAPGELDAARPLLFRSDAVGPVIAADEVAAGPA